MVVPISTWIIVLLCIVYFSYMQTIAAYPSGGGSGDLEIALRARELRESP